MTRKKNDVALSSFLKSWEGFAENFTLKSNLSTFDWSQQFSKVRSHFIQLSQAIEPDLPQMQSVENIEINCQGDVLIPARIYTPHSAIYPLGPALVFYHGGGFVMGDRDSYDSICRRLADASGFRVMSVEYRLAPEFKFPSQVNEAIAAFRWAVENAHQWGADPDQIAVGGDSAGGNLSIIVTRAGLQDECPLPAYQLLIYPLTQFVDLKEKGVRLQEGSFFSPAVFDVCKNAYLKKDQDPKDLRVSPLFYDDFKGLPSAHVITAGWDPLRDEGKAYADKLTAAGVSVTHQDYPSQTHGFFNTTTVSKSAREAIADAGKYMAKALAK